MRKLAWLSVALNVVFIANHGAAYTPQWLSDWIIEKRVSPIRGGLSGLEGVKRSEFRVGDVFATKNDHHIRFVMLRDHHHSRKGWQWEVKHSEFGCWNAWECDLEEIILHDPDGHRVRFEGKDIVDGFCAEYWTRDN